MDRGTRIVAYAAANAIVFAMAAAASAGPLPEELQPGWPRVKPVREFGPANLFRYNNGAARTYLAYGFVRLHTTQYAKPGARMVVDVFDMGRPLHAFGIYSTMRTPDDRFVDVGNQGVVIEGQLDFWHRRYFVHVGPAQAGPVADKTSIELGQAVAGRLGPRAEREPWVGMLPKQGLVANSVEYHSRSVLGCRALSSGFVATYELAGSRVGVVVVERRDAAEARAALSALREFYAKGGQVGPIRTHGERRAFEGQHTYYKRVVFAAQGAKLAGISRVEDEAAAGRLLDRLLAPSKTPR